MSTKVKLEIEFDLPVDDYPHPEIVQLLFDQFINFSVSHHLQEALHWTCETLSKSYENELVEDMLSLITSFSSKIYGRRSAENRKKKEVAK